MKCIEKNEGLLNFLTVEKISILDAEISRFDISYKNHQLNIEVYMTFTSSHSKIVYK
jgi:hypothetical protein